MILLLVNLFAFELVIKINVFCLIVACPPGSFFYNGSCYFYLPPKQFDNLKGIGFSDISVDEGIGFWIYD